MNYRGNKSWLFFSRNIKLIHNTSRTVSPQKKINNKKQNTDFCPQSFRNAFIINFNLFSSPTHLIKFYEQFSLKFILLCWNSRLSLLKILQAFCKRYQQSIPTKPLYDVTAPIRINPSSVSPSILWLHLNSALPVISEVKSKVSYRYSCAQNSSYWPFTNFSTWYNLSLH